MKTWLKAVMVVGIATTLSACALDQQERRMATGAAIGAGVGHVISGGDTAATVSGAAIGGLAGHQYDKYENRNNKRYYNNNYNNRRNNRR